jgi:hypothetical protein
LQEHSPSVFAKKKLSRSNFFIGSESKQWAGGCSHYEEASLLSIYPGIDLKMNCSGPFLKYDFIIAPQADVNQIEMEYYRAPAYIAHYVYQSEESYVRRKLNLPSDDNGIMRARDMEIH